MPNGLYNTQLAKFIWLKPTTVVEIEFAEWTADQRLRHAAFVGIRLDKKARDVVKEM